MDTVSIKAGADICQFINHTLRYMTSEQIEYIKDNVVDYIDSYKSYEDTDVFQDHDEDDEVLEFRVESKLSPVHVSTMMGGSIDHTKDGEVVIGVLDFFEDEDPDHELNIHSINTLQ